MENISSKSLECKYIKDKHLLKQCKTVCFNYMKDDITFEIEITQAGVRTIKISSSNEVEVSLLHEICTQVEKLLMIFDGFFLTLDSLKLSGCNSSPESIISYETKIKNQRLYYFNQRNFYQYSDHILLDYSRYINQDFFTKWTLLLDELDIVNQIILYMMSDNKLDIDIPCAILIEIAEPLVELVKEHTCSFTTLTPVERGTTLKMCVDALVCKYGNDIFNKELNKNIYSELLQVLVNTRVRVLHIKRKSAKKYLSGNESILYMVKIIFLYRRVLLEILGVDYADYQDNLIKVITSWDTWENVSDDFLKTLN